MSPGFSNNPITAESIRRDREQAAEQERQASLGNLSLHRVPPLTENERDAVRQQQSDLKRELSRDVIATIRPEEVSSRVQEKTTGGVRATLRTTDAIDAGATREQITSAAHQHTREVAHVHGLASHETERIASEVAELASGVATGQTATEEYLRSAEEQDAQATGADAGGPQHGNGSMISGNQPDRRGGKGLTLTEYSPRGRVMRIAA